MSQANTPMTEVTTPEVERCHHDSTRIDGLLDNCCMRCGADGYWLDNERMDVLHPSGKILFRPSPPGQVAA